MTIQEVLDQLEKYVTIDRFTPVERIVYGATGILLTGVMVAFLALVIKQ